MVSPSTCILIVDDDRSIREIISLALSHEGYEVLEAEHGAAALALVDEREPDVILLDMQMPIMDGWDFSRVYHQKPGPKAPIIVMTASCRITDIRAQIAADGFLGKPFELDELIETVGQYAGRG